ncbi:uncharacterized protein LOC107478138 [Arachis duranensis]|uniref:Uncharacterized protein LOC107478138 n=1 Tax=Arachis duranensis TaxID=130453 RepID=A0A6P4CNJ3_ARADU|nr:uncharacterized protein LOC107478138 [Arachis duranensis]
MDPHSITTDNGTQFTNSTFKNLVASMKIKHRFTSVEHPQANGQAEAANKVILAGLKKRLQVEINEQSPRVNFYDEVGNIQGHKEELDLLPEVREQAQIREAALKQRMTNRYKKKVIQRSFTPDNLVLIRNDKQVWGWEARC